MGGLPLSLRAVAGTECAGVWSTSKDCRMMMVACSRIQSLRVWSACMFVSAHASLPPNPNPYPWCGQCNIQKLQSHLSIYLHSYVRKCRHPLSLCGTEKIQSQDRCLFYHHRSARMYCTTEEAGWLQALRCAVCFLLLPAPTDTGGAGRPVHAHAHRRPGPPRGVKTGKHGSCFCCRLYVRRTAAFNPAKKLVPGRAPAQPRSKLERARGADLDTATPGEAGSMRDPLRGLVVVLVLVGRVALHRRACPAPPQFLSMQCKSCRGTLQNGSRRAASRRCLLAAFSLMSRQITGVTCHRT